MTVLLRPSSAYRWTRCAASVSFEGSQPPEPESDEAREGTAAAWVADCVLRGDATDTFDMVGRTHGNGWFITPDMAHHVKKYVDLVQARGGSINTEKFGMLNEFIGGTPDTTATHVADSYTLYIDDLKYGYAWVEPHREQLTIYAGIEMKRLFEVDPVHCNQIQFVQLGIFQPRAFHPEGIYRTRTIPIAQLWDELQVIISAGHRALEPNPVATPGNHCDYCRAAASCAALAASTYRNMSVIQDHRQRHMTGEELANELDFLDRAAKMLEARKAAIFAEGEARLDKGDFVPGWQMKTQWGHRKFAVPLDVVQMLTGFDPYKQVGKTPAELEREGANPEVIKEIAKSPMIGHKLVRFTAAQIEKAFGK